MTNSNKTLADSYYDSSLGLVVWVLCTQYYMIQIIAAVVWKVPYSLTQNTISDLGNTACGVYGGRFVCSPLHGLMNASFVVLGGLMIVGSILLYRGFRKDLTGLIGFTLIAVAGLGTILVGLFPENTIRMLHIVGAALPFVLGNLGLLFFGFTSSMPTPLRFCALISGIVSIAALVLFMTNYYLGIGIGGMERIVAYPQTIWLIVFGVYMLRAHRLKTPSNELDKIR